MFIRIGFHVVFRILFVSYLLYALVDQITWLGKRELIFCYCLPIILWFLFLLVLGMGCIILLWHSLDLLLII